jgi:SpoVK/Ycf46/Vps4 family AAA+-type ATPase
MDTRKALIEQRVLRPLREPAQLGGHAAPDSILLFGPPDIGKTALARAIAGRLGWAFAEVDVPALALDASRLGQLFERMLQLDQVVLFLGEFEHLGLKRERPSSDVAGLTARVLRGLPSLNSRRRVLLVCATNHVRLLDPRVLRPGHFDLVVPIGLPDAAERAALLRRHLAHRPCGALDLEAVVERSEGLTPADLVGVCMRAGQAAFERGISSSRASRIETADLLNALERCRPTLSARQVAAFHEDRVWLAHL